MRKTIYILLPAALAFTMMACGGGDNDSKEGDTTGNDEQVDDQDNDDNSNSNDPVSNSIAEAEKKMQERRAKGDTLAMNYKDLQKYLPAIDGYTKGEPGGGMVNMPGMSFSNAEAQYTDADGHTVRIEIIDYNQAYAGYTAATAMWAMGISVENDDEKAGGVKLDDNVAGWEVFKKKDGRATVTLGVGYRFWVNVEADNQKDTEWVKSVAKMVDLDKLAAM